jgi:hypothetical protein
MALVRAALWRFVGHGLALFGVSLLRALWVFRGGMLWVWIWSGGREVCFVGWLLL